MNLKLLEISGLLQLHDSKACESFVNVHIPKFAPHWIRESRKEYFNVREWEDGENNFEDILSDSEF